jgi:hypothetical protein
VVRVHSGPLVSGLGKKVAAERLQILTLELTEGKARTRASTATIASRDAGGETSVNKSCLQAGTLKTE